MTKICPLLHCRSTGVTKNPWLLENKSRSDRLLPHYQKTQRVSFGPAVVISYDQEAICLRLNP